MNQQPPLYPVVPVHMNMIQHNYQPHANLGSYIMAGQTSQAPETSQAPQTSQAPEPTTTTPTIWQVRNHVTAPAYISTKFCRFEKRGVVENQRVNRILHTNVNADIHAKVASLRKIYPELIRDVKKPTNWDDLYWLWDAADIQLEGPEFLYYVMHQIGDENEQLDRNFDWRKQEIEDYAKSWVIRNRELALNAVAGSMYRLFCSDPDEIDDFDDFDDFDQKLKPILINTLEAHRLHLLRDNSLNFVHASVSNLLQSCSMPQKLHHQAANSSRARAVSDKGDHLGQSGERVNRSAMPVTTGGQPMATPAGEMSPGPHGIGSTQARSRSILHGGRNLSMPLTLTTQSQSTPVKQAEKKDLNSAIPNQPQTYDHFMEIQRNMPTGLDISPHRPDSHRNDNGFRNKPRPSGHSIETPRNKRNQWTTAHGNAHQNKFVHQSHVNQQNVPGYTTVSPPRAVQSEPIYVRNFQPASNSFGDTSNQPMGNAGLVGSRMELPNDARKLKTFQRSDTNLSLNLGRMEGDPKLQKTDEFLVFRYGDPSVPRNSYGRTLYLKGPDLNMFRTHQLSELMSTVGKVVSIKYLLKPQNNGPAFVTFDADVVALAIQRFDGYKMHDGRLLTAGYPHDTMRERSNSNSSYNSYHGDNRVRYMPNAGLDCRAYSGRGSISQHRPSRSQSGQVPFQYPNGNHMTSGNISEFSPRRSNSKPVHSYPAPYAPVTHQQSPRGVAIGAVLSEVMQHERGIAQFQHQQQQNQMPLAVMNNRTNAAGTVHHRSYGGSNRETHLPNSRYGPGLTMANIPSLPRNRKENSPIKQTYIGDMQSTSPRKDLSNHPGSKHKKTSTSRQNTSTVTAPIVTPVRSLSQSQLERLAAEKAVGQTLDVASPENSPSCVVTSSTTNQVFTAEPGALDMEIIKQIPVTDPVPSDYINKVLPKSSSEIVNAKASEPVSQGKIKNSKKNKKQFKSTSKIDIDKENIFVSSTPAIISPVDSECTNPTLISDDRLSSGDWIRKPSVSSVESKSNDHLKDAIFKSQAGKNETEKLVEREKASAESVGTEIKPEFIPTSNITPASTLPNVSAVKSNHKRSKTGGSLNDSMSKSRSASAKDLKKQTQSNNSDNHDSSTAATGSIRKAEPKTAKSQEKTYLDGDAKFSGQLDQPKMDSNKKKCGLPEANQEKGQHTVSGIPTNSSDWPALAISKSPPSSIADGKPPQLPVLPALNLRRTKELILPALPLKPRRPSNDTLGSDVWPFVRSCKRMVLPESTGG
ncbi:hypothetical protein SBOR_7201 [Sclerotinia borealis F-4128]|uniref:RRM domain-containing protein n=1 Tax=Sclerotinia borealis (strain F-4128) TaxID=1432307 RepID=W9C9C7_SCLBF|nr:hypothetical protein SBOR_7201 [Sclerotinia borealis F-4128]